MGKIRAMKKMPRSITNKLILLFFITGMIPLLFISYFNYQNTSKILIEHARHNLIGNANTRALRIHEYFKQQRNALFNIAKTTEIQSNIIAMVAAFQNHGTVSDQFLQQQKQIRTVLKDHHAHHEFYDFLIISLSGEVVFKQRAESDFCNKLDQRFDQNAQLISSFQMAKQLQTSISGLVFFSPCRKPKVYIATPLIYQGRLIAILAAQTYNLKLYHLVQDRAGLGQTGEVIIASKQGDHALFIKPIPHQPEAAVENKVMIGSTDNIAIQLAVQGYKGVGIYKDSQDKEFLAAWRYLPDLNMGMVVRQQTNEALIDLEQIRMRTVTVAGITLFFILLIAALLTKFISTPLRKLTLAMQRVADGDMNARSQVHNQVHNNDEIAYIAQTFNLMMNQLQKLTASRDELNHAQQIGLLGSWDLDHVQGTLRWSDMAHTIFELEPEEVELSYEFFLDAIHPGDRDLVNTAFSCAIDDKTEYNIEHRLLMKDGRVKYVNERCYTDYDQEGKPLHSLGTIQDITERKVLEQKLLKLAQAVEQSSESIVITNLDAEIEYVNDAFVKITGYSREEVMGKNPRVLNSGRTSKATFIDMWGKLTQGLTWKGEFFNIRSDGSEYTEFAIITPIRQEDGNISHYVAVKEDITEKKEMGLELDKHRFHLEELVETRTTELHHALKKADAASQAKSEFLANMSHEIRTPMNAILGLTHILKQSETSAKQYDQLSKIDSAASHLLSILNNILDLSKVEAGKLDLEKTDFRIGFIFDHLDSIFKTQAENKGLSIHIDLDDVPELLYGDVTRLKQALMNYISNAIKFSEHGTIYLRAKKIQQKDHHFLIRFEVEDSGIGIEADKLESLFNMFEQVDTSISRRFGGTGLGLAITYRLARLMGGDAGVESEQGKGSLFWFTAWLEAGKEFQAELLSHSSANIEKILRSQYAGAQILLVEDNEINSEITTELLDSVSLSVEAVENGRLAVEKVRQHDFDLILMDIRMPEMNGLEATQLIRQMNNKQSLAILALSANAFNEDKQACFDAGMNDFVSKPVNPDDLFSSLIKWLPKREYSPSSNKQDVENIAQPNSKEASDSVSAQLANIRGLNSQAGLRNVAGNVETYLRLLKKFASSQVKDLNQIESLLKTKEFDQAIEKIHKLKGAAGNLGLEDIYQSAQALELSLRSTPVNNYLPLFKALSKNIEQFHQEIKLIQSFSNEKKQDALSTEELQQILKQLTELLASDNAKANTFFESHRRELKNSYGEVIDTAGREIENYQYPAALKIISSIAPLDSD